MGRAYIVREKAVIILNSSVIEQPKYSELKLLLEKYKNQKITDKVLEVEKVSESTRKIIKTQIDDIFMQAQNEWEVLKNKYEENNRRCSLCNQPNKYIFYIQNKTTGITLNVGSSCVQNFKLTEADKKYISNTVEFEKIKERKLELYSEFPNLDTKIFQLESKCENADLLLPIDIYNRIKRIIDQIKEFKNKYLSSQLKINQFDKLNELFWECEKNFNIANTWVSENKSNPLTISNSIKEQLIKKEMGTNIIELIRKNYGCVSLTTIKHINYVEFIDRFIDNFNKRINGVEGKFEIVDNKVYFRCYNSVLNFLSCFSDLSTFIKCFRNHFFDEKEVFEFTYVINCIRIDVNDKIHFCDVMNQLAYDSGQYFHQNDMKMRFVEIENSNYIRVKKYGQSLYTKPINFDSLVKKCFKYSLLQEKVFYKKCYENIFSHFTFCCPE